MRVPGFVRTHGDVLLAVFVLVAGTIDVLLTTGASARPTTLAMVAAMTIALSGRRRWPIAAAVAFFVAGTVTLAATAGAEDLTLPFFLVLILAYTLGSLPDTRTALRGLVVVIAGIAAITLAMGDFIVGDFLFPWGFATAAWGAGRTLRHRARLNAELHEAAVRAEEEREAHEARAVADERRRIAREMHDVVAHSVSVMVVQAGGARRILDRDPERAAEAARLIEQTGRSALLEMRRLLGVLATGDDEPAMAPQPSLADVDGLIGRAREAGLPVDLVVDGEARALPAGAEAAAYRVVQEALTNAMKHAGAAPTEVELRWDPDGLEIVVADRGVAGTPAARLPGGGHGIVGMRERVRCYGGELSALPRPDGGFVVRARIPLRQEQLQAA